MKIKSIRKIDNKKSKNVLDCFVDSGYRKLHHGSLPDIDTDFDSTKRDDVKAYLERRYNHNGKQRVFSAGTFTTLQVKSVIKDVCRVHRVSVNMANYITAIIDDNAGDWTELMLLAAKEKKVRDFIQKHPDVFEEIRPIMFQPRSEGIHASAVVVTPDIIKGEDVECFDIIPIKKMNGLLVSELSGTELDELGLLKNDLLGIAELSRLDTMIQICNKEYGANLSIESIATSALDEPKVYEIIRKGLTQGIFQLSSDGMTRYIKSMHPESINDIIAANALFRPATLDSGAAKMYVDAKEGVVDPEYLWGTYDILKDTFGVMCIAYDSLVKTNNGLEKIQDIEPNTYVQTEDGSYHIVLASMYKKCKQIISVRTSFGMEIKCTPDHRVLTQRGWVEAGKLNPKQDFIKCYWMTDDELPFGDMKDWCLGLYLANGSYSQTLNITCRNERDAYIIADRFNEVFGLDCRVYFHTRAWYVSLVNKKCYESSQNAFKKYIKDMGLENMSCYDKNVKRWSLMMLSGFFEGDGCVQNGRIRIKNPKLAMQIFMAAQAARIHSSYYEDIENNDVVYTIALSSLDKLVFQFKEKIQFSFPSGHFIPATCFESFDPKKIKDSEQRKRFYKIRKTNYCRLSTVQNYGVDVEHECWGRVLSIKDNGYEKTYDLSIDKNHSFVVGGHVVHNCYQEDYALISRKIGNLSLSDGVNLVKAISKKKVEKIRKFKDKFYAGAQKNGCPHEVADRIWGIIEGGASYGFNKCIAGDEHVMRSDRNTRLTIEEMYKTMNDREWAKRNGHISLYTKYQREGYGKGMSIMEDGRVHENRIVDITYSGVRPVYRITLDNGKTVQLTANHKCPTNRGEILVAEMVTGEDQMYVCGEYQKEDTTYRFTDKGKMNNPRYHNDDWTVPYKINSKKGHCGFTKRTTAYTRMENYRKNHMKDYCELCGKKGGRLEIHHKNGDHSFVGNHFENLITVCPSCHKKEHYKMGRVKRGQKGYPVELHTIVSIEHVGEKPVYDIEMADPCHNFANSNGIVVCNSHATAYGITAYIGAYIKALYPVAFYTVLLKWGKDENIPAILSEMREIGGVTIAQPDINVSTDNFVTDYQTNEIYWSLLRIKFVGVSAVDYIISERDKNGSYNSLEDFIKRVFRYKFKKYKDWDDEDNEEEYRRCPVNARMVRNLIYAGAFDKVEGIEDVASRYELVKSAAVLLGFEISEKEVPDDLRDKHWFWSQQQINLSGFGFVDYERIFKQETSQPFQLANPFFSLENLVGDGVSGRVGVCATVVECEERKFKDKRTGEMKYYGKITIQQNIDTALLVVFGDAWMSVRECFIQKKNSIVIFNGTVKWSDYDERNIIQINRGANVRNL